MSDETTTEEPRHITIAFDGACLGNPGPGGYGAILINDRTGSEKIVKGRDAATTNNKMELSAAIAGLNALRPGAFVNMLGDSQYVIKGFTEWLPNWKLRGWKAAGGKPVANVEFWRLLEMAVARHESVMWTWVKGHAGHELNERVDGIASGEAARA
ncbi:ribonuclease HI [Methylobacterium sp. WL120]|uniref:ribonuclease HI n=1 Tax=Methylobacterium sp. WL120 TaxID=2603887 RepID=UPI0011C79A2F|nr:ribonuclease HI [Methylobacterium sp. WL120]TXM69093.1 ribonuclease HI [Methylobacterium sp. WL120]